MFTATLGETLVWHRSGAVTRGGLLHAAGQLGRRLPPASCCINLCEGRLAFMIALLATAQRGALTLLPHSRAPGAVARLQSAYSDAITLDDACLRDLDWHGDETQEPAIDTRRTSLALFTSGSTGAPVEHRRSWASLLAAADLDVKRFAGERPLNLVATVPAQHMFGLQTTVLMPMRSHCAVHDGRPFFPADIAATLAEVPAPRALVSTPAHLRACLAVGLALPPVEFVLSATAPLAEELARRAEQHWQAPLFEIYGSTETGTVGTRRTAAGELWQLPPGARLVADGDAWRLHTAYLPDGAPLGDRIEPGDGGRFRLLGRSHEQVKIAGKRIALGDLTQALLAVDGVEDAVAFLPPDATRTAALVIAPRLDARAILGALATQIDPVFLPRPLVLVPALPRDALGKVRLTELPALLELHRDRHAR